jgi:hypothetical protein
MGRYRPTSPDIYVEACDFTLDSLCIDCPLNTSCGFEPAFGVARRPESNGTAVDIFNFEKVYQNNRFTSSRFPDVKSLWIARAGLSAVEIEDSFDLCVAPVKVERKIRSDLIVCGAMNRMLGSLVPRPKRNFKVTDRTSSADTFKS